MPMADTSKTKLIIGLFLFELSAMPTLPRYQCRKPTISICGFLAFKPQLPWNCAVFASSLRNQY